MTRREFSRDVRAAALKRCMDGKGTPRCEGCYVALKAGAFAFDRFLGDLTSRSGVDPADIDPLLANMQAAMRMAMYAAAVAIGILHGAIVWKLCTPAVRAEFR